MKYVIPKNVFRNNWYAGLENKVHEVIHVYVLSHNYISDSWYKNIDDYMWVWRISAPSALSSCVQIAQDSDTVQSK